MESSHHFVATVSPALGYQAWLGAAEQVRAATGTRGFQVWMFLDSWDPGLEQLKANAPVNIIEGLVAFPSPLTQERVAEWTPPSCSSGCRRNCV